MAASLACTGCGVDGLLLTEFTRGDNQPMPDPAPLTLTGVVADGAKAEITVRGSDGEAVAGLTATASDQGSFALTIDGASGLQNRLLQARLGRRQWLAVIPLLPKQPSVLAPAQTFRLQDLSPGALSMDSTTSALAVLALAKVRAVGLTWTGVSSSALTETLIGAHKQLLAGDPALLAFAQIVANIHVQAETAGSADQVPLRLASSGSFLNLAYLQVNPTDLDMDGQVDSSTAIFDAALAAALQSFTFKACYEPRRIAVVIETKLSEGALDGNCTPLNPYTWTEKAPNKQVFVTGGIHQDTLLCTGAPAPNCLTSAEVDAANGALGGWVPNAVPMFDDGSHGDGKAGDGVWTAKFDLPYIEAVQGVNPVRIAYKFTYGLPGQGWTDAEEFPGNQRILELVDVDGDHIVTRFDFFADETTNKDKKNGLFASAGGCGEMKWPSQTTPDCVSDTRERKVDLDGDCKADGFASPGSATPLAIACPN
ncbi:MAG: hypothetical protein HY902_11100 [Deltaproteobacteria bacterium]|nr:hypothetical protein [Deltaproteobacteria bacterium]